MSSRTGSSWPVSVSLAVVLAMSPAVYGCQFDATVGQESCSEPGATRDGGKQVCRGGVWVRSPTDAYSDTGSGERDVGGAVDAEPLDSGPESDVRADVSADGGGCAPMCSPGTSCDRPDACASGVCREGSCQAASCSDGVQNGGESGVDCGGGQCDPCGAGKTCRAPDDCQSGVCLDNRCQSPTCSDDVRNQGEADVDCGGPCSEGCAAGKACGGPQDCSSATNCIDGTCKVVVTGGGTADDPARWSDGTVAETCDAYRRPADRTTHQPAGSSGVYQIEPASDAYPVYCEMSRKGGGWTLVSVFSQRGNQNWTWANRTYFTTDAATFGDVGDRDDDYKNPGIQQISMADVLFTSSSGDWAYYPGVSNGQTTLGQRIDAAGQVCYRGGAGGSTRFSMADGTLTTSGTRLCSTDLLLNPLDGDRPNCSDNDHAFGPAWSASVPSQLDFDDHTCPTDDPGRSSSLGPSDRPTRHQLQSDALGFMWAMDARSTLRVDWVRMYVR